jgi:hypothetical protein
VVAIAHRKEVTMAVAFIIEPQDVKVEMYERVRAEVRIDLNPPPGLILHAAGEGGDGVWRVIEVWDSTSSQQTFLRERLGPALQKMGVQPPKITEIPLHHLEVPRATVA